MNNILTYKLFKEAYQKTRVYLKPGDYGFYEQMHIHSRSTKEKIGEINFRRKSYLNNYGYPQVLELHIGFADEYQGRGYFADAIIELLEYHYVPIYISKGRVVNPHVFTAIDKLFNRPEIKIKELNDLGWIIEPKD